MLAPIVLEILGYLVFLEGCIGVFGALQEVHIGGWRGESVIDGRCASWGWTAGVHLGFIGALATHEILLTLVLEAGILADKVQVDGVGGTAAVLGDDELGQAADVVALGVLVGAGIVLGTVDEAHDVGILLDGTRLTQVTQLRALAQFVVGGTGLDTADELRQGNEGAVLLLGQLLERA